MRLKDLLFTFVKELGDFSYEMSVLDQVWNVLFPDKGKKWHCLHVNKQDNIGIIPSHASLHRANQHFGQDKDVFDVMHFDDLGRFKRRIIPFITWESLPILRPMGDT
jgi:hypothetical protein